MFGIGMPELILILAVALIVIGPKKLPDLARSLGKALNEFKNVTQDVRDSINTDAKDTRPIEKNGPGRIGRRTGTDISEKEAEAVSHTEKDPGPAVQTGVPEYDAEPAESPEETLKKNE